jgi:hypothetical protein
MDNSQNDLPRGCAAKEGALAVWRALQSTVVIGVVAMVASAVRSGDFPGSVIVRLASSYRTLLTLIFLGLLIWEYWFRRVRRR